MTVENAAERPPILAITGIHKKFGRTHAVRGVDLVLREGEFVGLMGPNGAGKSTLIKILSGVYDADSGSISLDGQPVRNLAGRPEIGFVHQDLGLVDSMSVMDNLRLGARPLRLVGPVLHRGREIAFAQEALDRVGLDVALTANVGTLSPGEKALLAVAASPGHGCPADRRRRDDFHVAPEGVPLVRRHVARCDRRRDVRAHGQPQAVRAVVRGAARGVADRRREGRRPTRHARRPGRGGPAPREPRGAGGRGRAARRQRYSRGGAPRPAGRALRSARPARPRPSAPAR